MKICIYGAGAIGGYMAVHDRPAAFEGSDGMSYSVEIVSDVGNDDTDAPEPLLGQPYIPLPAVPETDPE